jgi:hypothetical protein
MYLAKQNKRLHDASAAYYKKFEDISILTAIVLGSAGSILNIVLGVIDLFSLVLINVAQINLGCTDLTSIAIITARK